MRWVRKEEQNSVPGELSKDGGHDRLAFSQQELSLKCLAGVVLINCMGEIVPLSMLAGR